MINWYKYTPQKNINIITINIQIVPNSNIDTIVGIYNNHLKIRLKALAIEGKANKSLILFLSKYLNIPQSNISIVYGLSTKKKLIQIFYAYDEIKFLQSFGMLF